MNVLVVDDNASVADSLAFLLDCHGHHASVAYDGETALRLLRTGAFEITFIDESLPDIKGSAIARSVRLAPFHSGAFLVSMTGDADSPEDNTRLFDVCLQKPLSCEALKQAIEDARCNVDVISQQLTRTPAPG
jgi:DNA-binding response OmpR family regulator